MQYKNEIQILHIVKFIPPAFILILSVITLIVIYLEHQRSFKLEKEQIEKEFLQLNQQTIKNQVNTVVNFILKEHQNTEAKLKESIKQRIYEAHHLAQTIYNNNQDKPEEELKERIKEALRSLRFNQGRGYYFINDMQGVNIMHPFLPKLENTNVIQLKNQKGEYLIQGMIQKLHNKQEAFHEWHWNKRGDKNEYKKIGFLKKFEPYDWFIGTAEYIDDFEEEIKKNVLQRINHFEYEKGGYIFIFHEDGTYLVHPRKGSIGKSIYDSQGIIDNKGKVVIKEAFAQFISIANKGGGFYQYIQAKKPSTDLPASKITYLQGVKDWNWIVGKGFYVDEINVVLNRKKEEVNAEFQIYLEKILVVTFLLMLFLLLISLFFSRIIETKFRAYKKEINNYLQENTRQQNMLAQQSKMAAMGEMIGNIAHQWRQPLSIISTSVTGLKVQHQMNILEPKEFDKTMDTINKSVQYLSHTIDDFRDFFKPNREKTQFNLKQIVQRSLKLVWAQLESKEINIIQELDDVVVNGYERELLQVMINLLNNAKDALMDIKSKRYIFIKVYKKNTKAIIEIKDNAGGVKPTVLSKIFEPYFTTKHKSQGTGIGLYMSKEIIEKHMQGELSVQNSKFEYASGYYTGAMFCIILPLKQKESS